MMERKVRLSVGDFDPNKHVDMVMSGLNDSELCERLLSCLPETTENIRQVSVPRRRCIIKCFRYSLSSRRLILQ